MGLLDSVIGAIGGGAQGGNAGSGGGVGGLGGLGGLVGGGGKAALISLIVGLLANRAGGQGGGLGGLLGGLGGAGGAGGAGGSGGLSDLIARFQQGGLGDVVGSWVGTGQNQPVSPDQVHHVLGSDFISQIAQQLGLSQGDAAGQLSQVLPEVVDKMTPDGQVPAQGSGLDGIGDILNRFGLK